MSGVRPSAMAVLLAARSIADHARDEGALVGKHAPRATCSHLGAVLADSVLQAGLNYATVVRPRVLKILRTHSDLDTVSALRALIERQETGEFLSWRHHEKVARFESLVDFLYSWGVEDAHDLRERLGAEMFREAMQALHGIGPKTIDYMACLVGIESIAVDRHVRTFARRVGVENDDYYFLRKSFCCAADLLALSRREFDAWLWRRAAVSSSPQLGFAF